jgi:hypothetical protein
MGIDPLVLPTNSPVIGWAFQVAMMIVNPDLATVATAYGTVPATSLYELAVYNLAGDNLVNYAPDQPGRTYFADLRASLNLNAFTAGVVTTAADQNTSDSLAVPDSLKNLTIADLQNLKTPWGRAYLAIAQRYGTLWGLS